MPPYVGGEINLSADGAQPQIDSAEFHFNNPKPPAPKPTLQPAPRKSTGNASWVQVCGVPVLPKFKLGSGGGNAKPALRQAPQMVD